MGWLRLLVAGLAALQLLAGACDGRITDAAVVRDDRRVILLANPFGCGLASGPGLGSACAPRPAFTPGAQGKNLLPRAAQVWRERLHRPGRARLPVLAPGRNGLDADRLLCHHAGGRGAAGGGPRAGGRRSVAAPAAGAARPASAAGLACWWLACSGVCSEAARARGLQAAPGRARGAARRARARWTRRTSSSCSPLTRWMPTARPGTRPRRSACTCRSSCGSMRVGSTRSSSPTARRAPLVSGAECAARGVRVRVPRPVLSTSGTDSRARRCGARSGTGGRAGGGGTPPAAAPPRAAARR